jgi:hypothetical protein
MTKGLSELKIQSLLAEREIAPSSRKHQPVHRRQTGGRRKPPAGGLGTGSGLAARKIKKNGRPKRVRRQPDSGSSGTALLSHLCEVMELFPSVGEEALGELAGRMMAERLRRETADKKHGLAPAKTRRWKRASDG